MEFWDTKRRTQETVASQGPFFVNEPVRELVSNWKERKKKRKSGKQECFERKKERKKESLERKSRKQECFEGKKQKERKKIWKARVF